jgi:hypothetical protein
MGIRSLIPVALALATFALGAGCGGGGGGGEGASDNPTPVLTVTLIPTPTVTEQPPSPTPTPASSSAARVAFDLSASAAIIAARVDVVYDQAKGSFAGSGSGDTSCTLGSSDVFASHDDGVLRLGLVSASGLALPATVTCTFEETAGALVASDLGITSATVAILDSTGLPVAGNPDALAVTVTVTRAR